MSGRLVLVVVLAACGRIDFDRHNSSDVNPDGMVAATCEPAAEVCDGIDDNCDGVVDEGCPCQAFDMSTPSITANDAPGVVWTGSSYLATVFTSTGAHLLQIAADGTPTILPVLAPGTTVHWQPSTDALAWTGDTLAAVWDDLSGTVWFSTYDASGAVRVAPFALASNAAYQHVLWTGDRFAVSWIEGMALHLLELAPDASPLGAEQVYTGLPSFYTGMTALAPDRYLMTVVDTASTAHVVTYVRTTGQFSEQTVPMSTDLAPASLVAGPGGFLSTWNPTSGPSSYIPLDSTGTIRGPAVSAPMIGGQDDLYLIVGVGPIGRYAAVGDYLSGGTALAVEQFELDADGNTVFTDPNPTIIPSVTVVATPSTAGASGRGLSLFYVNGTLHFVQRCY